LKTSQKEGGRLRQNGNFADAAEKATQKASSLAVGDAAVAVFEQAAEDVADFVRNIFEGQRGDSLSQLTPADNAGIGPVLRLKRGLRVGSGKVMTAELLIAKSDAAAFAPVGQDKSAFGSHLEVLLKKKKPGRSRAFVFLSLFYLDW
jgi:hypothetical protein